MAYVLRHHRTEKGSEGKLRHSTQQATVVSAESPSLSVMRTTQGQKVMALRSAAPPRNPDFLSQSHIAPADLRPLSSSAGAVQEHSPGTFNASLKLRQQSQ